MSKVTYRGPSESVDIPLEDGTVVVARRGVEVEVPADVAKSLASQDAFASGRAVAAKKAARSRKKQAAAADTDTEPVGSDEED